MKKLVFMFLICASGALIAAENEKKPEIQPVGTQNEAILLINRLIEANQSFSVKLSNPMLPGKIRSWQQRGIVRYPTKMTPWVTFKKDIQQFGADLHQLLSKDPQGGNYYHLDALRKNHALYKQLQVIDKVLKSNEPAIEMAKPLMLGKESLESMQKIINAYGTAFYQEKLLEQIAQTIKGFDKEAESLRKAHERAAERARGKSAQDSMEIEDIDFDSYEPGGFEASLYEDEEPVINLEEYGFDDDFVASFFN